MTGKEVAASAVTAAAVTGARRARMTPQEAAAEAAEILEQAAGAWPPEQVTAKVAIADGWRRLALALHALNYPPVQGSGTGS